MGFFLKKLAIAIDIGGTNTKVAVISNDKEILHQEKFRTVDHPSFNSYLKEFQSIVTNLLKNYRDILGVGIGVPNFNPLTGNLVSPPNLKWGNINIYQEFKNIIDVPLHMDNDANVAAIGEKIWGHAHDCENFVVVTVGTGIGTGVFVNNKIVHGFNGIGGEGGHLIIKPDGRLCGCGGNGHFESYCSVSGIKKTYFELTNKDLTYREIVAKYQEKDESTIKVFKETAKHFAIGISQITALLSPKRIILMGGGMAVGKTFLSMIQEEYQNYCYQPVREIPIILSEQAVEYGAILGCAGMVFHEQII